MKRLLDPEFTGFAVPPGTTTKYGGAFVIPLRTKAPGGPAAPYVYLRVIASNGEGWDHVSVVAENPDGTLRQPRWNEMEYVKRKFFKEHEVAVQLHVPPEDHINLNPNCLHIWRKQNFKYPLPPKGMV